MNSDTNWQVIRGEALASLRTIRSDSVDAVVMDPPFSLPAQHYAARKEWARTLADLSILEHFFRDVFQELRRVVRQPGHLLSFSDAQSYPVFYVCAYRHFPTIQAVVWDKGKIGMGRPWRNQHEIIIACADSGAELQTTCPTVIRCDIVPSGDRIHPAEKPVALMRRLVSAVCPPGGITLDPFCGSGATGEACLLEGRRFIGIEVEPDFALLAEGRLSGVGSVGARSTVTQPSLFAPLGGD